MKIVERIIENSNDEGVILEYVTFTKDFAEIKEYVQHKGDTIIGYGEKKEWIPIRIEDILYYESVDGIVFAYTDSDVYKIKGKLYQVEEKIKRSYICRASKSMLVNMNCIESVRTALNGRLYAKMENKEEILITRKYAKMVANYFFREDEENERI